MHNALPKEASLTASVCINILFTVLRLFGMFLFCLFVVPGKRVHTTYTYSSQTRQKTSFRRLLACSTHSNHSTSSTILPSFLPKTMAPKRTAEMAFEDDEMLYLDIPIDPRLLQTSDDDLPSSSTGMPIDTQPLADTASARTPSLAFEDEVDTRIRTYIQPLVATAAQTTTPEMAYEDDSAGTSTGLSTFPGPSGAAANPRASDDEDRANREVTAAPIMSLNRARNSGPTGRPIKPNDKLSKGKQAVDQRSRRKIEEDYRQRILAKVDKDIIDQATSENKTTPTGRTYRAILTVLEQNEALIVALARENEELKKQLEEAKKRQG